MNCSNSELSQNRHQVLAESSLTAMALDIPSISVLLYQDSFSWQAGTGATKGIMPPKASCSLPKGQVAARVTHTATLCSVARAHEALSVTSLKNYPENKCF